MVIHCMNTKAASPSLNVKLFNFQLLLNRMSTDTPLCQTTKKHMSLAVDEAKFELNNIIVGNFIYCLMPLFVG